MKCPQCSHTLPPGETVCPECGTDTSPKAFFTVLGRRLLPYLPLPAAGAALLFLFIPFLTQHNAQIDLSALYGVPLWNLCLYYCAGLNLFGLAAALALFFRDTALRTVLTVSDLAAAAAFSLFLVILGGKLISPVSPSLYFWNQYAREIRPFAWLALLFSAAALALSVLHLIKGGVRHAENG